MSAVESGLPMKVRVNGQERALASAITVADLLRDLGIETPRVAVELNREILPKPRYGETSLREGDSLEIVQFVGGG